MTEKREQRTVKQTVQPVTEVPLIIIPIEHLERANGMLSYIIDTSIKVTNTQLIIMLGSDLAGSLK